MTKTNFLGRAVDSVISTVAPIWGAKRARARFVVNALGLGTAYTGGSRTKRSLRSWSPSGSSDPDDEVMETQVGLRERSRDLYRNNSIAGGAIKTVVTNVIGTGLRLQCRVDRDFLKPLLNWTDEQFDAWETDVERQWRNWSESNEADASRRYSFLELQDIAFRSSLMSGDCFALLPLIPRPGTTCDLRVQLLEADRVSNPPTVIESLSVAGGIEVGKYGEPVAYYVVTSPLSIKNMNPTWQRVSAFGSASGRVNVIHLYTTDRPGQRRGVPFLTPIIEPLKQLGRYSDTTLTAAVVQAMFTAFIKSETNDSDVLGNVLSADEKVDQTGRDYELGPGAIVGLAPGEDVVFANPSQPTSTFDTYWKSCLTQMGMALEIPVEILIKSYTSSYTAARAAFMDAWRMFKTKRVWMANRFCQPIYEEFLMQKILAEKVVAPGFLDYVEIRRAFCAAKWEGPAQGQVDPTKEIAAASDRVNLGVSTLTDETASLSGADWETVIRQRAKEERRKQQLGLMNEPSVNSKLVLQQEQLQGGPDNGQTNSQS